MTKGKEGNWRTHLVICWQDWLVVRVGCQLTCSREVRHLYLRHKEWLNSAHTKCSGQDGEGGA